MGATKKTKGAGRPGMATAPASTLSSSSVWEPAEQTVTTVGVTRVTVEFGDAGSIVVPILDPERSSLDFITTRFPWESDRVSSGRTRIRLAGEIVADDKSGALYTIVPKGDG
jgi:hypothetical protein